MSQNTARSQGSTAEFTCPDCSSPIPLADVNVATDIAICRACAKTFALSSLQPAIPRLSEFDGPPPWIKVSSNFDGSQTLTYRKFGWECLFLIPFTLVWGGGSLGGIYGSMIYSGNFDPMMALFGLPFLIGTIVLVSLCAMSIAGKTTFRISPSRDFSYYKGAFGIGRRVSFPLPQTVTLTTETKKYQTNGKTARALRFTLQSGKSFTTSITHWKDDSEAYILAWLNQNLHASV